MTRRTTTTESSANGDTATNRNPNSIKQLLGQKYSKMGQEGSKLQQPQASPAVTTSPYNTKVEEGGEVAGAEVKPVSSCEPEDDGSKQHGLEVSANDGAAGKDNTICPFWKRARELTE